MRQLTTAGAPVLFVCCEGSCLLGICGAVREGCRHRAIPGVSCRNRTVSATTAEGTRVCALGTVRLLALAVVCGGAGLLPVVTSVGLMATSERTGAACRRVTVLSECSIGSNRPAGPTARFFRVLPSANCALMFFIAFHFAHKLGMGIFAIDNMHSEFVAAVVRCRYGKAWFLCFRVMSVLLVSTVSTI